MKKSILITGANRGIGLEFTRQYLTRDCHVFACCRTPEKASSLHELTTRFPTQLDIVTMDVSVEASIQHASVLLQEACIDVVVNNAGTGSEAEHGIASLESDRMVAIFKTNAIGPVCVVKHFLRQLQRSQHAVVVNIISGMGFMREAAYEPGMQYSYGSSKAALNMLTKYLSADLREDGVTVIGVGPGYVLTDMTRGGKNAPVLRPDETVPQMIALLEHVRLADTGSFFEYDGRQLDILVKY